MKKLLWIFHITLYGTFVFSAEQRREVEFSVYAQHAVRGVDYKPECPIVAEKHGITSSPVAIATHFLEPVGPYRFTGVTDRIAFQDTATQEIVAEVILPGDSSKWLFIFINNPRHATDPKNQFRYLIYPFDRSRDRFPSDSVVFLNISSHTLEGFFGEDRLRLPPGESPARPALGKRPLSLWMPNYNQTELLSALSRTFQFGPNQHHLMILFPPVLRSSSKLDVRFLSEHIAEN